LERIAAPGSLAAWRRIRTAPATRQTLDLAGTRVTIFNLPSLG
jgi:hypothetical protein